MRVIYIVLNLLKNSIITTYIRDLVQSTSIYFDPDITMMNQQL